MRVLCAAVTSCGLLSMPHTARAQRAAVPPFTLKQVGANVWAAIDNPAAKALSASSNGGFVIGDDGVAVIDTFNNAEAARQLLAEIRRRTTLPIRFVVNTHHHPDHVAGNGVFADTGATILAHRNVRPWIRSENLRFVDEKTPPDIRAWLQGLTPPSAVYTDRVDLYLGKRPLQVRFFPGHTGGDSVVFLPDARVVFAGDLLWRKMTPTTIDGTTTDWIATLDTLAKTHPRDTFIPGHGDVAKAPDIVALREFFSTLRALVVDAQRQGKSGAALVSAVRPGLKKAYGQWEGFEFIDPSITEMEAELAGRKRVPHP